MFYWNFCTTRRYCFFKFFFIFFHFFFSFFSIFFSFFSIEKRNWVTVKYWFGGVRSLGSRSEPRHLRAHITPPHRKKSFKKEKRMHLALHTCQGKKINKKKPPLHGMKIWTLGAARVARLFPFDWSFYVIPRFTRPISHLPAFDVFQLNEEPNKAMIKKSECSNVHLCVCWAGARGPSFFSIFFYFFLCSGHLWLTGKGAGFVYRKSGVNGRGVALKRHGFLIQSCLENIRDAAMWISRTNGDPLCQQTVVEELTRSDPRHEP